MTLEDYRRFYAEEIEQVANLTSAEVRAMAAAGLAEAKYRTTSEPRHLYHNVVVSLDRAKDINNGQPSALAGWINALDLKSGDRVYHMGCGVGYYTAIMAEMVGPVGSVVALDAQPDLAARAKDNLSGYLHVAVHAGDGAAFDPGPCDAMLIDAGVTHPHKLWLDRLREGGRLVMPLTIATSSTLGQGAMVKIVRESAGFAASTVTFLAIFNAASLRDPELDAPWRQMLGKAMATGTMFKVKSLRRDTHEPDESCVLHTARMCLSTKPVRSESELPT